MSSRSSTDKSQFQSNVVATQVCLVRNHWSIDRSCFYSSMVEMVSKCSCAFVLKSFRKISSLPRSLVRSLVDSSLQTPIQRKISDGDGGCFWFGWPNFPNPSNPRTFGRSRGSERTSAPVTATTTTNIRQKDRPTARPNQPTNQPNRLK